MGLVKLQNRKQVCKLFLSDVIYGTAALNDVMAHSSTFTEQNQAKRMCQSITLKEDSETRGQKMKSNLAEST